MMKKITGCFAVVAILSWQNIPAEAQRYEVVSVEDGDTLVVLVDTQPLRVQLLGIDAPENVMNPKLKKDIQRTQLSQQQLIELGELATNYLRGLLVEGQVGLQGDLGQKDKYGRVPVMAFDLDGRMINQAMVVDGYAVVLGGLLATDLQQQAMLNQQGLWAGDTRAMTKAWAGLVK